MKILWVMIFEWMKDLSAFFVKERISQPFFFLSVCVVNVSEIIFSQHTSLEMIHLFSCKNFWLDLADWTYELVFKKLKNIKDKTMRPFYWRTSFSCSGECWVLKSTVLQSKYWNQWKNESGFFSLCDFDLCGLLPEAALNSVDKSPHHTHFLSEDRYRNLPPRKDEKNKAIILKF